MLYSVAAFVAVLGTALLAVFLLGRDSPTSVGTTEAAGQRTGFALFDTFHATLILTPAVTGRNDLDLILASHDGSGAPDLSELTVTAALPSAGVEPREYPAVPVADSPGAYRVVGVSLPEPGDWEFIVSVVEAESGPATQTAIIPIGAE